MDAMILIEKNLNLAHHDLSYTNFITYNNNSFHFCHLHSTVTALLEASNSRAFNIDRAKMLML